MIARKPKLKKKVNVLWQQRLIYDVSKLKRPCCNLKNFICSDCPYKPKQKVS